MKRPEKPDPIKTPAQVMHAMGLPVVVHPKTEEEARAYGKTIDDASVALLRKMQERGVPANVVAVLMVEARGGDCPRCGQPWVAKTTKNRFAEFVWYDPACRCYYRCPACHRSLHELEEAGKLTSDHCPYCRYRMFEWIQGSDGKSKRVSRLTGVDGGSRTREGRADARR